MSKPLPPLSYLQECFNYDTDTGVLTWRERPASHFNDTAVRTRVANCNRWNARHAGTIAGYVTRSGYRWLRLNGGQYQAHLVAFKMGKSVELQQVNHLNGERDDNRLANLACETLVSKKRSKAIRKANKSGVTGVAYLPKCSKHKPWRASGELDGSLGYFPTLLDAACARLSWQNRDGFTLKQV